MYNAKFLTVITLIVIGLFVFMALGSGTDSEVTPAPSDDVDDNDAVEEQPEETDAVADNSRRNPAGVNERFVVTKDDLLLGKVVFEIEMLELISGEEAWDIVRNANPFNERPDEGKEYILAKFEVAIISTEEDKPYDMNHAKFSVISDDGVEYTDFISVAGLEPDLRADLYEGAVHRGWTYFIVNVDDSPVGVIYRGRQSEIWFDLRN